MKKDGVSAAAAERTEDIHTGSINEESEYEVELFGGFVVIPSDMSRQDDVSMLGDPAGFDQDFVSRAEIGTGIISDHSENDGLSVSRVDVGLDWLSSFVSWSALIR